MEFDGFGTGLYFTSFIKENGVKIKTTKKLSMTFRKKNWLGLYLRLVVITQNNRYQDDIFIQLLQFYG